jgi:hypothetical protein
VRDQIMIETVDFFEQQGKECRSSAAQSRNKNDREFWLELADRWEGLLKNRHDGDGGPVRPPSPFMRSMSSRSMALARLAKRRRAA